MLPSAHAGEKATSARCREQTSFSIRKCFCKQFVVRYEIQPLARRSCELHRGKVLLHQRRTQLHPVRCNSREVRKAFAVGLKNGRSVEMLLQWCALPPVGADGSVAKSGGFVKGLRGLPRGDEA